MARRLGRRVVFAVCAAAVAFAASLTFSPAASAASTGPKAPTLAAPAPGQAVAFGSVPADPMWPSQWGYAKTSAPQAWATTATAAGGDGDGVIVAVLDTGLRAGLPDLGATVPGYDFVNGDADTDDDNGHGTMVAGLVNAVSNNGIGIAGWCGRCVVMPVKVLDATGIGSYDAIGSGIVWAADHGARVINLSLGGTTPSPVLAGAVAHAQAKGALVVAAAGNMGSTAPTYPAALPGVIAVASAGADDGRPAYSNHGDWVDVAAPAPNITTMRDGSFRAFDGTSSASAMVAGAAALAASHAPSANADQIADALRSGAVNVGGFVAAGRIDAARTVALTSGHAAGAAGAGYWMLASDGRVHGFGAAGHSGSAPVVAAAEDIEQAHPGDGYWVLDSTGAVHARGVAAFHGHASGRLQGGEHAVSMTATPTGGGYWIFTNRGRVFAFGDAPHYGDMTGIPLNSAVLDSVGTPTGAGYFMVAADGGIFAFGDAAFHGSMGGRPLNAPVQSLVPDGDGRGYWLVASDGGIFAFDAPFLGSMGGTKLNRPVTGMVGHGSSGYLMVAADGGIFAFGDAPFHGSLGATPSQAPVVAVAAATGR